MKMSPKIKKAWQWIGTLAASGILITVVMYAMTAYIHAEVNAAMVAAPPHASVSSIQTDHLLINDALVDLTGTVNETRESQQRFEELFIEYLGRQ